jgi:hypothetical protein
MLTYSPTFCNNLKKLLFLRAKKKKEKSAMDLSSIKLGKSCEDVHNRTRLSAK